MWDRNKTENLNPKAGEGKYEDKKMHLLEQMKMIHPCCYVFWRWKHSEKKWKIKSEYPDKQIL